MDLVNPSLLPDQGNRSQFREWELAQLAADPADEQQRGRVRALFHRQLQVPLVDGSDTLEKYQTWESSLGSASKVRPALPCIVQHS